MSIRPRRPAPARPGLAAAMLMGCTTSWIAVRQFSDRAWRRAAARSAGRGERGDVPGWVLVTLMTAGLVFVLWGLARQQLSQLFERAISSVDSIP
jgi:hypothetical protein